nr:uncharacterized protein LOC127348769 [Lolium perenne]
MTVSTPTRPGRHAAPSREETPFPVTPPSFLSSLSELSLRRRCRSPSAPTRNASLSEPTPWSTTSSAHPSETARVSSSASQRRRPLLLCVVFLVPELPRLRRQVAVQIPSRRRPRTRPRQTAASSRPLRLSASFSRRQRAPRMRVLSEKERILVRMSKRKEEQRSVKKKSMDKYPTKASHLLMHTLS